MTIVDATIQQMGRILFNPDVSILSVNDLIRLCTWDVIEEAVVSQQTRFSYTIGK